MPASDAWGQVMKSSYLISCASIALLSGWIGVARAEPVVATAASAATAEAVEAAAAPSATPSADIIVTAQRREQSVQKVPNTIQVFTGAKIEQLHITTLEDLLKFTPNVTYGDNGPGQGEIFMRGLSNGFRGNQSSATIANYGNVALYLDEEAVTFPARNLDVYAADFSRIEVLEGPQGTLFGGGAEAGAVRYITNKPRLGVISAGVNISAGVTEGGAPNASFNTAWNLPVGDKLAFRAVLYADHQGGYIDNVPSTFTHSNNDNGIFQLNIHPNGAGICPNGLPAGQPGLSANPGFCAAPNSVQGNNFGLAGKDQNPTNYLGGRLSALYEINDDWNVLITESLQDMHAFGTDAEYPIGSDFQPLKALQVTAFSPAYEKDQWENTAWTLNGKLGPLKAIYTGSYLDRHIKEQQDYSNYSRSVSGIYYTCTGGNVGWGGPTQCFSPVTNWTDEVTTTHLSNEVRLSTPDDWRFRAIGGAFFETFRIYDNQNFNYRTIPACTPTNLAIALGAGLPCVADVRTAPGSTANHPGIRSDTTAFGEDTQRGYDQTAFFISADFDIIPHVLTVTAGTRWYQYREFLLGSQYQTGTECLDVPNGDCGPGSSKNIDAHNDHVTYTGFKSRINVSWFVTPDTMTYFTFSQGFRPGGFNRTTKGVIPNAAGQNQFLEPNGYSPDSLNNYEVGLKTQLFDHRLLVNLSAYYMQWSNAQFLIFNPTLGINTTFGINGPNYEVKGLEGQLVAKVADGLTVQGSFSYNDDTQSSSPCLPINEPGVPGVGQCITVAKLKGGVVGPFANPFGSLGSTPAFSPKFQGNLQARYEWTMGGYNAFAMGSVNYTGAMFNQPSTYPSGAGVLIPGTTFLRYEQPAYTTLDASIGIAKGIWHAELFGTNLTNSHASTFTSSAQFIKSEIPLRPLVVGVRFGADFQ
jgi:iron complex outermembrane receptor protein